MEGKEEAAPERKVWAKVIVLLWLAFAAVEALVSVQSHNSSGDDMFGFSISGLSALVSILMLVGAIWRGIVPFADFREEDVKLRPAPLLGWCEVPYNDVESYTMKGKKVFIRCRGDGSTEAVAHTLKISMSALVQSERDTFLTLLEQHLGPAAKG